MAACAALALLLQRASPQLQWSGLAIAAVAAVALLALVDAVWRRRGSPSSL
jgi:type III secretory pathway component EscT